uniref:RNA binding motif protein 46 n=1 Tax=Salarias fasciatus TaxID=181472 RepID=A0A672FR43_SALFA
MAARRRTQNPVRTWTRTQSAAKHLALLALMERTGYEMLQVNGQRTYGPPPGWDGPPPPHGCEVFVGKIPRDMYEDELVPLFERAGQIYEFRLMLEFSGENRGYGFVKDEAHRAIQLLDNSEVRPGKFIGVCPSVDNCRLFISPIPRDETKDHILEEMKTVTDGVVDVIVPLNSSDEGIRNRGFAFIEYESHKAAALARRKLITVQPFGHHIRVKWAESETDKNQEAVQHIKVLYVCNLQPQTSEETLQQEFSRFSPGCVERVKKFNSYAFIHYRHRGEAMMALRLMNGAHIDGAAVEVRLAKEGNAARRRSNGQGSLANLRPVEKQKCWDRLQLRWTESLCRLRLIAALCDPSEDLFPLLPGTPLSPTSLLALKSCQLTSGVSLLEFHCMRMFWSPPEYYLFSTQGPNGKLLLIYKVVIPSTQRTFMPSVLCLLQENAKELAAKFTLWSLGTHTHTHTHTH